MAPLAVVMIAAATGSHVAQAQTETADARAIRETDVAWSRAAEAKDLERMLAFFAEGAAELAPNTPMAKGKDALRKTWSQMMTSPGFAISWQPTTVEASRGGDLGYSLGTYSLTMHDPTGKPVTDRGKYVTVWKKQADGTWKVIADIFNSNLPPGR